MNIIGQAIEVEPWNSHKILTVRYAVTSPGTTYTTFSAGNGTTQDLRLISWNSDNKTITFNQKMTAYVRLTIKAGYSGGSLYTAYARVRKKDLNGTITDIVTANTTSNAGVMASNDFTFEPGELIYGQCRTSKDSVVCITTMVVCLRKV